MGAKWKAPDHLPSNLEELKTLIDKAAEAARAMRMRGDDKRDDGSSTRARPAPLSSVITRVNTKAAAAVYGLAEGDVIQWAQLVMAGGGMLGIAHVGFVRVLEEAGIRFLGLGGTSAGAINAVLIAALRDDPMDISWKKTLEVLEKCNFADFEDDSFFQRVRKIWDRRNKATQAAQKQQANDGDGNKGGKQPADDDKSICAMIKGLVAYIIAISAGYWTFPKLYGVWRGLGMHTGDEFHGWIEGQLKEAGVTTSAELLQKMRLPMGTTLEYLESGPEADSKAKDKVAGLMNRLKGVDASTGKLLSNPRLSKLLGDPTLSQLLGDPPLSQLLSDPPLSKLLGDPPLSKLLSEPLLSKLLGDPTLSQLLGDPPLSKLLREPLLSKLLGDPTLSQLLLDDPPLKLVASEVCTQTMVVFPEDADLFYQEPLKAPPADFVRASMSVPMFFRPFTRNGKPTGDPITKKWRDKGFNGAVPQTAVFCDGGTLSNFPIALFHKKGKPVIPTIGIQLGEDRMQADVVKTPVDLMHSMNNTSRHLMDRDFLLKNRDYKKLVGIVDTRGFGWLDFSMDEVARKQLLLRGMWAGLNFLETKREVTPAVPLMGAEGLPPPRAPTPWHKYREMREIMAQLEDD